MFRGKNWFAVVGRVPGEKFDIHPCIGCVACGYEGPCVQKDDVEGIKEKLLSSDMVVFATPLYYYGMSAQLKAVVMNYCSFLC